MLNPQFFRSDFKTLKAYDRNLDEIVPLGWGIFGWINRFVFIPLFGFLSGFFGGLSGNQGALRSAFLVKHGLEKSIFVATTVAISSLVDITRLSVYSTNFLNLNYSDFYQLGFFSVVSAVAGSFIGNKLLKKVTIEQIKKLVALLLILLGISLLIGIL